MPIVYKESDAYPIGEWAEAEGLGCASDTVGLIASDITELLKVLLGDPFPLLIHVENKKQLRVVRREMR